MPIDYDALVSPVDSAPTESDSGSKYDNLVSPVDIKQQAKVVKEQRPDIGTIEELEGMLSLASSFVATPLAGLNGLGQVLLNSFGLNEGATPTEMVEYAAEAFTYKPRTEGGKAYAQTLATPFEYIDKAATWVGDQIYDVTGSPTLGASAKAGTVFMVPKAIQTAGTGVKLAAEQAKQFGGAVVETVKMVSPKARSSYSQEAVSRSLTENIGDSPEVLANLAESARLSETIPGYKNTLAEATLKPGLMARERNLAEQTQEAFNMAKSRREANLKAVEDYRMAEFGDSAPEVTAILKNSEGNINKAITSLDNRLADIAHQREVLASQAPSLSPQKIGSKLREIEAKEYQAAKAAGDLLYKKIGNERVDPSPISQKLDAYFKDDLLDYAGSDIPPSFNFIRRKLSGAEEGGPFPGTIAKPVRVPRDETISFDSLRSMEKRLNNDLASEAGSFNPNKTKMRLISGVLEKVEEVKLNLEKSGGKETVQALRDANAYWKEGVVDRFYKGAGRDISAKNAFNEYRIVDEKVIDSFFAPATKSKGGVKGIDDFINTYGMNPSAWAQLRLGIYAKFRKATGIEDTGVINTAKANNFMNKHRDVLDRVPAIRDELASFHEGSIALDNAAQAAISRQANIKHSVLSRALKSEIPDSLVKKAIKESPSDMRVLKMQANKIEGGVEALSTEVGRQLLQMAERPDGTINSTKLLHEINRNKKSLTLGMTPGHLKTLKDLHQAYARMDQVKLPTTVKEPKLGLELVGEKFGTTPAQAISAWRAKSRGLVGGPHLVAQLGTSFITKLNKNQINAIERIAHYDKGVAETLLKMSKEKKVSKHTENKIMGYMAKYGLLSLSASAGIDEE